MVEISEIPYIAAEARRILLQMNHSAGSGHTGADLSEIDILCTLWGVILQRGNEDISHNDRFILSKAHGAGGFYATLMALKLLDRNLMGSYEQKGSRLPGHPVRQLLPDYVEINAGGLGHGLPVAVGLALAKKRNGQHGRVFVLLGDGELAEGSNWEGLMCAAKYGLSNLFIVIDRNWLQIGASTSQIMPLEPLVQKFRAFRADVTVCDGHAPVALMECIRDGERRAAASPHIIIAQTVKGRGISFMENDLSWHHRVPDQRELERALKELN